LNLFTKPLDSVVIEDIEAVTQAGLIETAVLDYKEDMAEPKKLARTIAALGNTMGGHIIIGVKQDQTTKKPEPSPSGIVLRPRLDETVRQVAGDSIRPGILPEIRLVPLRNDAQRCVLVIRVQQSHQAPHATDGGTRIYRRRDDLNQFEELATLEWIEHLLETRREPERRRLELASKSRQYLESRYMEPVPPVIRPFLVVFFSPIYPGPDLIERTKLKELVGRAFRYDTSVTRLNGVRSELVNENFLRVTDVLADGRVWSATRLPLKAMQEEQLARPLFRQWVDAGCLLSSMRWTGDVAVRVEVLGSKGNLLNHLGGPCHDDEIQVDLVAPMREAIDGPGPFLEAWEQMRWRAGYPLRLTDDLRKYVATTLAGERAQLESMLR